MSEQFVELEFYNIAISGVPALLWPAQEPLGIPCESGIYLQAWLYVFARTISG